MMRNRRMSRMHKERIAMIASSLLIVTACALTGVYINGKEKSREKEQVVDFSTLEDGQELSLADAGEQAQSAAGESGSIPDEDLDLDPAYQETGSASVVNPPAEDGSGQSDGQELSPASEEDTKEDGGGTSDADDADEQQNGQEDAQETISLQSAAFTESDKLAWPVQGDVLMNYSMDHTIYFATLSQYKYNPALVIQGEVGSAVKAPAAGAVKEVGQNSEIGKYVVLDLGNGYELTLGQLDHLTVKSGDAVGKEQTIGKVAEPSKYYSVEGSNLYMKLTKDGESVNPMSFLS